MSDSATIISASGPEILEVTRENVPDFNKIFLIFLEEKNLEDTSKITLDLIESKTREEFTQTFDLIKYPDSDLYFINETGNHLKKLICEELVFSYTSFIFKDISSSEYNVLIYSK